MDTPFGINQHEADYKKSAWEGYQISELGQWVHLLARRAEMRINKDKARKDLIDAQNYLDMMQAILDDHKTRLL